MTGLTVRPDAASLHEVPPPHPTRHPRDEAFSGLSKTPGTSQI
jgi:hypothetical protein